MSATGTGKVGQAQNLQLPALNRPHYAERIRGLPA
jgi:hypothetical protein